MVSFRKKDEAAIIYEDANFLAVNKPAHLLVQPIRSKVSEPTLVDWLLERYPEISNVGDDPKNRPGIVHRLDQDTSGVILVAKNQQFFDYLKNLFKTRQIKKRYLALVYGRLEPAQGLIEKPIGLKSGTVKRTVHLKKSKMIKPAITEYRVKKYLAIKERNFSLVELFPQTGRTHQLRVHLASVGHPIVGDRLYGPKNDPFNLGRQFLHAESLEFSLPEGRRLRIEAALPSELSDVILKTHG